MPWQTPAVQTDELRNGVAGPNNSVERLTGEHIETQTPSSTTGADFTDLEGPYSTYTLSFADLVPASDGANLDLRLSTDGGASYIMTGYKQVYQFALSNGSSGVTASNSTYAALLSGSVGNGAGKAVAGYVSVSDPSTGSIYPFISGQTVHINPNGDLVMVTAGGVHPVAQEIDAIRLRFSGTDITNGRVSLRGVME
jgi:hypothetical protein